MGWSCIFLTEVHSRNLYVNYHVSHPFPETAAERREMLSCIVGKAWDMVRPDTIVNGFRRAHLIPVGTLDQSQCFGSYRPLLNVEQPHSDGAGDSDVEDDAPDYAE